MFQTTISYGFSTEGLKIGGRKGGVFDELSSKIQSVNTVVSLTGMILVLCFPVWGLLLMFASIKSQTQLPPSPG